MQKENRERKSFNRRLCGKPLENALNTSMDSYGNTFLMNKSFDLNWPSLNQQLMTKSESYSLVLWDGIKKVNEKVFQSLNKFAITQSQEVEIKEIEQTSKLELERVREEGPESQKKCIEIQFKKIKEVFKKILGKIELMASKSFQNYKIKDLKATFNTIMEEIGNVMVMHISPYIAIAASKLRVKGGVSILTKVCTGLEIYNKRKALSVLRSETNKRLLKYLKLQTLIRRKGMKRKHVERITIMRGMLSWRLATAYSNYEFSTLLSDFCKDLFNTSWEGLNRLINKFFIENTKAVHADYIVVNRDNNTMILSNSTKEVTKSLSIESITTRVIKKNFKLQFEPATPIEIPNLLKDPKVNDEVDLPEMEKEYERLSLMCIPIMENNQCMLGVLRIYIDGSNSNATTLTLAEYIAQCLNSILPKMRDLSESKRIMEENIRIQEEEEKDLREKLEFQRLMREGLEEVLIAKSSKDAIEVIKRITKADKVSLLQLNTKSSKLIDVVDNEVLKESIRECEAIRKGKIIEVTTNKHTTTYLPIITSNCKGLLRIEHTSRINICNGLKSILPACLIQVSKLSSIELARETTNKHLQNNYKEQGAYKIFGILNKMYLHKVSYASNTIGRYIGSKYKNSRSILLPLLVHIIAMNLKRNTKFFITKLKRMKGNKRVLEVLMKIMKYQLKQRLRVYWIMYKTYVHYCKHKEVLDKINKEYAFIPNLKCNNDIYQKVDTSLEYKSTVIELLGIRLKQKMLIGAGSLFLRKVQTQLLRQEERRNILRYLVINKQRTILARGFQVYKRAIHKLQIEEQEATNKLHKLYNLLLHQVIVTKGSALNIWRNRIMEILKNKNTKLKEDMNKLIMQGDKEEFTSNVFNSIKQLLTTTVSSSEELLANTIFKELITNITKYYCKEYKADICLITILLNNKYYIANTSIIINENDDIIEHLNDSKTPLKFINVDPINPSIQQRNLKDVKVGLATPIVYNKNLIGSIELYKKTANAFNDIDIIKEVKTVCLVANRVLEGESQKIEMETLKQQGKLLYDSLLSSISNSVSLNLMLTSMSTLGSQLLGAEKVLIVLIKEGKGCFYIDSSMYSFEINETFIESIVNSGKAMSLYDNAQSINEEEYGHIRYLPIKSQGEVKGVCEVCYNEDYKVEESLEMMYLNLLDYKLEQYKLRLVHFLKVISGALKKKEMLGKKLLEWRINVKKHKDSEVYKQGTQKVDKKLAEVAALSDEYKREIEVKNEEIKRAEVEIEEYKEQIESLKGEQEQLDIERSAKLKFLASALLFNQMETYLLKASRLHNSWEIWFSKLFTEKAIKRSKEQINTTLNTHKITERNIAIKMILRIRQRIMHKQKKKALRQFNKVIN